MRAVTEEALRAMHNHVEERIHNHGSIHISKDAGMFISRK